MKTLALHPNDAGITLLDDERIHYRQPGFALIDGERISLGDAAFRESRIAPRGIQHRYWATLNTVPLPDRRFEHLTAADLVSRHLEEVWKAGGGGGQLIIAVPAWLPSDSLGLLLGIASELDIRTTAMVDAAVAATRREYRNAVPVHVDMGLHRASLTRIGQPGHAAVERSEILEDCGLYGLYDTWLRVIAEAFVRQSRFDPLHTAETEQALLDQLARWLSDASSKDSVAMKLQYAGLTHEAEIETLELVNAVAPVYQSIASRLRALCRAGDTPALQLTDRVSRLPGLAEHLRARVGGDVFSLEPGATARGALARMRGEETSGSVSLRRQLPWDQSPYVVEVKDTAVADAGTPTHVLFRHVAHAITAEPLLLGSQAGEGGRAIVLDADMPGVSRLHCSLRIEDGRCVVEDSSRYGTFLNGHRIDGSTVLQVGDSLRVGSPGFEFTMITTDEAHGT